MYALNSLSAPREVPPAFLSAHIAVIPKPNKDPLQCSSYRPISLLNHDVKLLAKIIANRLRPLLHDLIGPEQADFMPGRKSKDNVTKALNLIHAAHMKKIEGLLLSTNAEKAFNRVAWDYMLETCKFVGLGTNLMTWITSLYMNPSAQIKINGSLSDTIHIHNGTRQGCPLSPLVFIISLEPFIRKVIAERTIKGFMVADREFKVAAYADDLLFFLTDIHISLPTLMKEFSHFGYISNLKINYSKSEAMNISIPKTPSGTLKLTAPLSGRPPLSSIWESG